MLLCNSYKHETNLIEYSEELVLEIANFALSRGAPNLQSMERDIISAIGKTTVPLLQATVGESMFWSKSRSTLDRVLSDISLVERKRPVLLVMEVLLCPQIDTLLKTNELSTEEIETCDSCRVNGYEASSPSESTSIVLSSSHFRSSSRVNVGIREHII